MDWKSQTDRVDEAPFNMAMLYYLELHHLRQEKARVKLQNNIPNYYECLYEIFIHISFKLSNDEKENIQNKFKEASVHLGTIGMRLKDAVISSSTMFAKNILSEIDMELLNLMHKYKMIFPNIETHKGLKELDKRFGLNG